MEKILKSIIVLDRVERGNNHQNSQKLRQGNYSGVKACMKSHYNLYILGVKHSQRYQGKYYNRKSINKSKVHYTTGMIVLLLW